MGFGRRYRKKNWDDHNKGKRDGIRVERGFQSEMKDEYYRF